MSIAEIVILCEVSSSKLTSEIVARTGASFTGLIIKSIVSKSSNSPSDTLTVIDSEP